MKVISCSKSHLARNQKLIQELFWSLNKLLVSQCCFLFSKLSQTTYINSRNALNPPILSSFFLFDPIKCLFQIPHIFWPNAFPSHVTSDKYHDHVTHKIAANVEDFRGQRWHCKLGTAYHFLRNLEYLRLCLVCTSFFQSIRWMFPSAQTLEH